jgi:hypothetical protein
MLNGQVYEAKTRTNQSSACTTKEVVKWALKMQYLGHVNHKNTIVNEGK